MSKKSFCFLLLSFFAFSFLFAARKNEVQHPENMNSWQNEFDIDSKKGKYNIVVEAEDQAGNIETVGPYNIYIDEESDLPVTSITNPSEQMRVPGNLNIVGTCIDDDEVAEVYIILDGDKENPIKVEGTEYWSYYLDTTKLLEGPHTIEAYGIDNGNPEAYRDAETGEIDESKVKPKTGHSVKVTWQLDRRTPTVEINSDNHYMGELVRGKITLEGKVKDGNGIKALEYSTDGGRIYKSTKIKEVKLKTPDEDGLSSYWTFSIPLDTKKLYSDGAATCWFKATDGAGSVGKYAFLFFVDNTNPEIVIVSPQENEVVNGVFTVAGYAYDANHIAELSLEFMGEKAEFKLSDGTLTPGNPYFVKDFDTRGKSSKAEVLTVTAIDKMGNLAEKKQTIILDQEADKPIVLINYPTTETKIPGADKSLFIRGIASDDDGVSKVFYKLDNGEEQVVETDGVFYAELPVELSDGLHTISTYAVDKYGVKGNLTKTTFTALGAAPSYENPSYRIGKESVPYVDGMQINPEADGTYEITVNSSVGVIGGHYQFLWKNGENSQAFDFPEEQFRIPQKSTVLKIPLNAQTIPYGTVQLLISTSDERGTIGEYKTLLNILDLTKPHAKEVGVYFTDSTIDGNGGFVIEKDKTLDGYFIGSNIASVSTIPSIRGVTAKANGNLISVSSENATDDFVVRVTTTDGATYDSRSLHFVKRGKLPELTVEQASDAEKGIAIEFANLTEKKTISGFVDDSVSLLSYRILAVKVNYDESGFLTSSQVLEPSDFVPIQVNRRNQFSVDFTSENFEDGISVVEIVASNSTGSSTKAVFVKKINPLPENQQNAENSNLAENAENNLATENSNQQNPNSQNQQKKCAVPSVYWLKGNDYYGITIYQGKLGGKDKSGNVSDTSEFVLVKYDDILKSKKSVRLVRVPADVEPTVDPKAKKGTEPSVPEYVAELTPPQTQSSIEASFDKIDSQEYKSGMNLVLARNSTKEEGHSVLVSIKSAIPLQSVDYEIFGEEMLGGDQNQKANLTPVANPQNPQEYQINIPLYNLPARLNTIKLNVNDSAQTKTFTASFMVLREHSDIDNEAKIYWAALKNVKYDSESKAYILGEGEVLNAFANFAGPVSAELRGSSSGLSVQAEGNLITLSANQDGTYKDVSLRVTGKNGSSYNSSSVNLIVDTKNPEISLENLENMSFIGEKLSLVGIVSDENGISKLEYSLQDGNFNSDTNSDSESSKSEWQNISVNRAGRFEQVLDFSKSEDGYIPLSLKATDKIGKVTVKNFVFFKDTTPPEVQVLIPVEKMQLSGKEDLINEINGETDIVFKVKDNGSLNTITYTSESSSISDTFKIYKNAQDVPVKTKTLEQKVQNANGEEETQTQEIPVKLTEDSLRTMNSPQANMRVGTKEHPLGNKMFYTFTDLAGNSTTVQNWKFVVNEERDKPIVEIHLPTRGQVITTDFTISGIIYDDDGECQFFYRIDDEEWQTYDYDEKNQKGREVSNFKIERKLSTLTDNEHTIWAYAVDKNGVKGNESKQTFRVSLEEPKGSFTEPDISKTISGTVTLRGKANDKNGINKVQISVDNGTTYNDAEGTEDWSYTFDTRVIQDGTHVVFLKIWDGYDIIGLYTSLINIDNTPPELKLELPLDDTRTSKDLFFSGQTTDNIGLKELYITIRSLENKAVAPELAHRDLVPSRIISEKVDLSSLNNGFYNIELTGTDAAGNITRVSRNIELNKDKALTKVDLLYPLNGSYLQGEFNVYGMLYAESTDPISKLEFYLDGNVLDEKIAEVEITDNGYYKVHLQPKVKIARGEVFELSAGEHKYQILATTQSGNVVSSNEQSFVYTPTGPWVTIENFTYGDFAVNRPLLKGKAGYSLSEAEKEILKQKDTPSEIKRSIEQKKVKMIYISFDNGKTFTPVAKEGKTDWSYRVENLDIPAGYHFMLLKAEMYNGENAITRTIVQVDRTKPSIKLISPGEGGHYNQKLEFSGLSSDDIALKDVRLTLRKGDKASYEVPSFIQGLYFDANFWGATLYSLGVGLTAFDNAVKIQGQFGQFTKNQRYWLCDLLGMERSDYRFGGNVIGAKIIAQVGYIPFRYFFGRDWDWLSATISVGANFSYFSDSGASIVTGERVPQVLSAALVQIEFPRITIQNQKLFRNWSLYAEPQVWFIPSDIASDDAKKYVFTVSGGLRATVF